MHFDCFLDWCGTAHTFQLIPEQLAGLCSIYKYLGVNWTLVFMKEMMRSLWGLHFHHQGSNSRAGFTSVPHFGLHRGFKTLNLWALLQYSSLLLCVRHVKGIRTALKGFQRTLSLLDFPSPGIVFYFRIVRISLFLFFFFLGKSRFFFPLCLFSCDWR